MVLWNQFDSHRIVARLNRTGLKGRSECLLRLGRWCCSINRERVIADGNQDLVSFASWAVTVIPDGRSTSAAAAGEIRPNTQKIAAKQAKRVVNAFFMPGIIPVQ